MATSWLDKLIPQAFLGRLRSRGGMRRILVNTFWLFVDQVLYLGLGLVVGALVARYLGPSQWGLLGYAASFSGLFLTLSTLGMDEIVVRALVRKNHSPETILGTSLALRTISALLSYLLLAFIIHQIEPDELTRLLVLVSGGVLLLQPINLAGLWFQANIESKYVVWMRNATLIFVNALKLVFIAANLSVLAFAWAATLWKILSAAGLLYIFINRGPAMRTWRYNSALAGELLHTTWPLIIAGLAASVYIRIDQVLLGNMIDSEAVGIYAAAVRVSELWYFIPSAIAASVYPILVQTRDARSPQVYRQRTQAFYDLLALLGFSIALFVTLTAEPFIQVLFGPDYLASIPILRLHIWSVIFVCLGTGRDRTLLAENMSRLLMITTIIGALINIGLNLWLIPLYAGYGAAWATVIAYASAYYLATMFTRRQWPLFKQLSLALLLPLRLPGALRGLKRIF